MAKAKVTKKKATAAKATKDEAIKQPFTPTPGAAYAIGTFMSTNLQSVLQEAKYQAEDYPRRPVVITEFTPGRRFKIKTAFEEVK